MSDSPQFPWPEGQIGAVSLTFDDAMRSHFSYVIPELNNLNFRGTFYVNPGREFFQKHLDEWRAAHEAGHEIGNHTMSHACDLNVTDAAGLRSWTLERMEADILECERVLNECLPNPRPRSFAYPCYETDIGHGLERTSYVPIVAKHFPGARSIGYSAERGNHPEYCDLHRLSSRPAELMGTQLLVGCCQTAIYDRSWIILTFHGLDEGHLPVAKFHFRRLLDYLDMERGRLWTAPVVEVAEWIGAHRTRY